MNHVPLTWGYYPAGRDWCQGRYATDRILCYLVIMSKKKCGAKTGICKVCGIRRSEHAGSDHKFVSRPCRLRPVTGSTRCMNHGGKSPKGALAGGFRHGMYTVDTEPTSTPINFTAAMRRQMLVRREDFFDITGDIVAVRALVEQAINDRARNETPVDVHTAERMSSAFDHAMAPGIDPEERNIRLVRFRQAMRQIAFLKRSEQSIERLTRLNAELTEKHQAMLQHSKEAVTRDHLANLVNGLTAIAIDMIRGERGRPTGLHRPLPGLLPAEPAAAHVSNVLY